MSDEGIKDIKNRLLGIERKLGIKETIPCFVCEAPASEEVASFYGKAIPVSMCPEHWRAFWKHSMDPLSLRMVKTVSVDESAWCLGLTDVHAFLSDVAENGLNDMSLAELKAKCKQHAITMKRVIKISREAYFNAESEGES